MFLHSERSTQSDEALLASGLAQNILADVMQFRRVLRSQASCLSAYCQACSKPHLSKVALAISAREPIPFVLPAFPGKSPNTAKVLGPLPDMAEKRALQFLQQLCDRIKRVYSPGARVILCSDGRVFSDVVGMRDQDVTAYQQELSKMITHLGLTSISTYNLDEIYKDLSFSEMRRLLMHTYGNPLDTLKAAVSRGSNNPECSEDDKEAHRLYCGITRFLFEDAMTPGQTRSRTSLQNESRVRAYEVIQRSKAWGHLVEELFPNAVRLSIHPQTCGAEKLGIKLIEPDNWLTPWHSAAIQINGRFMLMKSAEAEKLGAKLVYLEGRPSHYVLV